MTGQATALDSVSAVEGFGAYGDAPEPDRARAPGEARVFLSKVGASGADRRLALTVLIVSAIGFVIALPFAGHPLPRLPAFIPTYEAALVINDLISAVLLFGQFAQLRQRALLVLASGYLFDALIVIPHVLTFPGVFSATGLLGAGPETAAWIYVFWHGGFAALILLYAILAGIPESRLSRIERPRRAIAIAAACVALATILLTATATAGRDLLPVIIEDGNFALLVEKGVSPSILVLILAGLIVLWRRPSPTVLDLWVLVVLGAWFFDVALSAVVPGSRYDLCWYAGRAYGLLAASFVLIVLLTETIDLQSRLAVANDALADYARTLGQRVRARTSELAESNAALRREIEDRKVAEARLVHAQKIEAIGNLTGGMAHDFNNLLGVIIGNLDLLRDGAGVTPDQDGLVADALEAALKGADLTRRLLAFARRQPLQPRLIDINEHIGGIAKLLARTLGEQVSVELCCTEAVWPVLADPAQLEASIMNLANNARDAMPDGGRLTITTANRILDEDYVELHADLRPGEYAMIEVSDSGCGMPREIVARVFEPFFTTKSEGKGTGLGLSMVFGFMKQSDGHINVYSEPGVGTTFRLYLPRALDLTRAAEPERTAFTPVGNLERVLVVEDKENLRRIVVRQLLALGYRAFEAEDVRSALAVLNEQPIDLVFSDVVMPGGASGHELARIAIERWPHIKIVLTSGFPDTRMVGARDESIRLLSKPYRRDDLGRALRGALDS